MSQKYNYKEIIKSQLPHKVYRSNDVESSTLGNILNKLQSSTDELELNVNPSTAMEDGILAWEKFLKLVVSDTDTLETRRDKVLSGLIQYLGDESVITKNEMENILNIYLENTTIEELPAEYKFIVNFIMSKDVSIDTLTNVIREVKPSYLDFDIELMLKSTIPEINIGVATIGAADTTVYPYKEG